MARKKPRPIAQSRRRKSS